MAERAVVLVVPDDPMIGALMVELVSVAGHVAEVVRGDESVRQAIQRVTPALLLVDCDHAECDERLREAAARCAVPVVYFSGARSSGELERLARRHGVRSFKLPNGPHLLDRTIREAVDTRRAG